MTEIADMEVYFIDYLLASIGDGNDIRIKKITDELYACHYPAAYILASIGRTPSEAIAKAVAAYQERKEKRGK